MTRKFNRYRGGGRGGGRVNVPERNLEEASVVAPATTGSGKNFPDIPDVSLLTNPLNTNKFGVMRNPFDRPSGGALPMGGIKEMLNKIRSRRQNPFLRRFHGGSCTVDITKVPVHPYGIDPKALKFPLSGGKMLIISPTAKNHKYTQWNNNGVGHYSAAISFVQPYAPH